MVIHTTFYIHLLVLLLFVLPRKAITALHKRIKNTIKLIQT